MSYISNPNVNVDNPVTVAAGTISVDNFPASQPVSGSVSVSNFPATQPVSIAGVVNVLTAIASTATLTVVTQPANTSTQLLASNASRKSAILFFPKAATTIAYDTTASAAHFTYKTGAASTTIIVTGYTGPIFSFGPADTINVTELA